MTKSFPFSAFKLFICLAFFISLQVNAQNFSTLFVANGNTTGASQNPLSIGNWSSPTSVPQYRFYTNDQSSPQLQVHSTRWGGGMLWTRDDPNGMTNMMSLIGWNGQGGNLFLYDESNQVKIKLNTVGQSFFNGGVTSFGTSNTSLNGNVFIQGGAGTYQAWWLTGGNGVFKIGGNGATEPSAGAINIDYLGNVSIGTLNNFGYKLAVNGTAIFTEARVKLYANWPDYVFKNNYRLLPLKDLEKYISANNHLPNIPSAKDIQKDGINLGEMNAKLLEKIEELALYIIELKKENEQIKEDLKKISK